MPSTPMSTSRTDGVSGIRLFPGADGGGVDVAHVEGVDGCTLGEKIPQEDRIIGTAGLRLCQVCAQM